MYQPYAVPWRHIGIAIERAVCSIATGHFTRVCCGQPLRVELRDRARARLPVQNTAPACLDPVRQWRHQSKTCHDNSAHLLMPLSFLARLLPRGPVPVQVLSQHAGFVTRDQNRRANQHIGGRSPDLIYFRTTGRGPWKRRTSPAEIKRRAAHFCKYTANSTRSDRQAIRNAATQ